MNCKQYRACLMGIIIIALLCGMFIFIRQGKENRIPAEGTLVQHVQEQDGIVKWV